MWGDILEEPEWLTKAWADWETLQTAQVPLPAAHVGYYSQRHYWARYREGKRLRYHLAYGRYRRPYFTEGEYSRAIDRVEVPEIRCSLEQLPRVPPPPGVPRLRKRRRL